MTIDTSGKWWVGSSADDIAEYLKPIIEDYGYSMNEYRPAKCSCGSIVFSLKCDALEGAVKRFCVMCDNKHFICDSEEFWEEAEPKEYSCVGNLNIHLSSFNSLRLIIVPVSVLVYQDKEMS